jgi:hypothetical protein
MTKPKRLNRAGIAELLPEVQADLAKGASLHQISSKHGIPPRQLARSIRDASADSERARLQQLEKENRQLRHAVARLEVEKTALAEVVRGNF